MVSRLVLLLGLSMAAGCGGGDGTTDGDGDADLGGPDGGDGGADGDAVDADADAPPVECAQPLQPRLRDTHTGWREPNCRDCHEESECEWGDRYLDQCVECHSTNGAPWAGYRMIYEAECLECHTPTESHGGRPDFIDPASCRSCHRPQNTETHTGYGRANCVGAGCHGPGWPSWQCAYCHLRNGAPMRPNGHTTEMPCADCHETSPTHGTDPTDFSDPDSCRICHPPECVLTPSE